MNRREHNREYQRERRQALIELLGGECVKCKFNDWRALQIDHIKARGKQDFKRRGNQGLYLAILAGEKGFQLLCANCNWTKRYENKEAGGRPRKIDT